MLAKNHVLVGASIAGSGLYAIYAMATKDMTVHTVFDYFLGQYVGVSWAESMGGLWQAFVPSTNIFVVVLSFVLYFLGTVIPDIDNPDSKVGRIVHVPVVHRGILNALWIPVVLIVSGFVSNMMPVLWFGLGWLSHIVLDKFSIAGSSFFYPLGFRKVIERDGVKINVQTKNRTPIYAVGGRSEYVFASIIVLLCVLVVWFFWQV